MKFFRNALWALAACCLALGPALPSYAADNVAVTVGSGKTMACKDVSSICVSRVIMVDETNTAIDMTAPSAVTQSGTWNITNLSGTVSLPTGASTAAKQPALGTAGTASSDVLTVQGIASMTPFLVTGSYAQGSTTSGQTGAMLFGAATTSAPTYTTANTYPFSLTTSGALRTQAMTGSTPVDYTADTTVINGSTPFVVTANSIPTTPTAPTFQAVYTGLVAASSATDLATITGSSSKLVVITRAEISGIATAATTIDVQLIKRSAADTSGTQTAPTSYVALDSTYAGLQTVTIAGYTANPTTGSITNGGIIASRKMIVSTAATPAVAPTNLVFDFNAGFAAPVVLRGTAQQLAINLNGATISGNSFNVTFQWMECTTYTGGICAP